MLCAHLESPFGSANREVTAAYFRLAGNTLVSSDEVRLAAHLGGMWQTEAKEIYTAIQFLQEVALVFLDGDHWPKLSLGPCRGLRIVGSSMWRFNDRHELVARLDDALAAWHVLAHAGAAMPCCEIRPV